VNTENVDLLIAFILSVAAQQDPGDRELGNIHILKYAYLADLAFAQQNNGQTFTGSGWNFYNFGPWSPEIFNRIEPAAQRIGAEIKTIQSKKFDDYTRYYLEDDQLRDALDRRLPIEITSMVGWAVRKFTDDTESLLHYVYLTEPILNAAPGENLVFLPAVKKAMPAPSHKIKLTPKQEKKYKVALSRAKEKFWAITQKKLEEEKRCKQNIPTPPYDDVYMEALSVFDALDGPPISVIEGELIFSDDVWYSDWRKGPERS